MPTAALPAPAPTVKADAPRPLTADPSGASTCDTAERGRGRGGEGDVRPWWCACAAAASRMFSALTRSSSCTNSATSSPTATTSGVEGAPVAVPTFASRSDSPPTWVSHAPSPRPSTPTGTPGSCAPLPTPATAVCPAVCCTLAPPSSPVVPLAATALRCLYRELALPAPPADAAAITPDSANTSTAPGPVANESSNTPGSWLAPGLDGVAPDLANVAAPATNTPASSSS